MNVQALQGRGEREYVSRPIVYYSYHYKRPFVLGNTSFSGSRFIAILIAFANALKIAKILSGNVTDSSLALPMGFKSPWNFGIGVEYSATDRLKLRAGYEPRTSAIPKDKRNTMVPINGAQLFGLGVGYRFDADTDLDLSIGFLRSKDQIPANTSSLANQTGVNNLLLNPYAGLNIKTDTKITILGLNYRTRW